MGVFIGQLDTRIAIVELSVAQNSIGENKPLETVFCEPWAKLEDVSGSEEIEGKVLHRIARKYTIRFYQEILKRGHEMLLVHDGQKFSISHVKQLGRRAHLEIYCNLYE